jgi:hypothetical protein
VATELKTEEKKVRLTPKAKRFVEQLVTVSEKYRLVFGDGTAVTETSVFTHSLERIFLSKDCELDGYLFLSNLGIRQATGEELTNYNLRNKILPEVLNGNGKLRK